MVDQSRSDKQLIVVVGMHRSGTSVVTHALEAMGVKLGNKLMPPSKDNNETGFFEDLEIVTFNEEILNVCGKSWLSIEPIKQVDVDYLCDRGYLLRAVELLHNKLETNKCF